MTPAPPFIWHQSVGSTQNEAHKLAAEGAVHGTTVATIVQTHGRGTRGRSWSSGLGGVWLSVVCRPESGATTDALSLRIGLGLADLIDRDLPAPHRVALKWPNDLYLGEKKVGGILVEAVWRGDVLGWMAIGVGINARNEIPSELANGATRLLDLNPHIDPSRLAALVSPVVARAARHAAPLTADELAAFESRDWLRGRALSLPEPGVAEGITAGGRLRVRSAAGIVSEVMAPVQLALPA